MTETEPTEWRPHSAHWGTFAARWTDGRLAVRPHAADPDPNAILENFTTALRHKARIAQPMVRRGWLDHGPRPDDRRGRDEFIAVSWDRALDLLAAELTRVRDAYGAGAIFGGSYGWASAGRFHHAQGQMHRFLNTVLGGYVRSVNSYSAGASNVILPHILGSLDAVSRHGVTWDQVAAHSEVVVAFGGMALKNSAIAAGGVSRHVDRGAMQAAQERGARFVLISPLRDDLPERSAGRVAAGGAEHRYCADAWSRPYSGQSRACTIELFWIVSVSAIPCSRIICSAAPTGSRRMPPGPPASAVSRQTISLPWRAQWRVAAR